jgi:hypothetical protein
MGKIFSRRGQAALEFLTTYGWAFMVILVMIGALAYFGVLNPGSLIRDQCMSTTGVDCKSHEVFAPGTTNPAGDTLSISFTNNLGTPIAPYNLIVKKGDQILTSDVGGCNLVTQADGTTVLPNAGGSGSTYPDGVASPEQVFLFSHCPIDTSVLVGKKGGDKVKLSFTFEYIGTEPGEFSHVVAGTLTTTLKP